MDNYVFSSIIGAAVIEFVSEFLPISAKSPLRKYIRYIISLIVALTIISPVISMVRDIDTDVFAKLSGFDYSVETNLGTEPYLYVSDTAVYAANSLGEKSKENPVFCDMYIAECVRRVGEKAKEELARKFSLDKKSISVDIAVDVSDSENIELICANIGIYGANSYLISDACDYLSDILECRVIALKQ